MMKESRWLFGGYLVAVSWTDLVARKGCLVIGFTGGKQVVKMGF